MPTTTALALKNKITLAQFQPVLNVAPKVSLSSAMIRKADLIDFSSAAKTRTTLKAQRFTKRTMTGVIHHAFQKSDRDGGALIKAYVDTLKTDGEALEASSLIMNVARVSKAPRRRVVLKSLVEKGRSEFVVHNIGGMAKKDARSLMLEFFRSGGKVDSVATWLAEASNYLDESDPSVAGQDGLWGAIKKGVKKAVDWTKGAIKTVGDALASAAKKLGSAIKAVAKWSTTKIRDFVKGLIRAGRSAAAILTEVMKQARSALNKFVSALLKAGQKITAIVNWAASQVAATFRKAISALLAAGKRVAAILKDVASLAQLTVNKVVAALVGLGKAVKELVQSVAILTAAQVKKVLQGLLQMGKKVGLIIAEAAKSAVAVAKRVVAGLLALGKSVAELVTALAPLAAAAVNKIVSELLKLGKKVAQIMAAAIRKSTTLVRKIARAIVAATGAIRAVLNSVAQKLRSAVAAALRGIIDAGIKIHILARNISRLVAARARKLVTILFKITRKAAAILKGFVVRTVSAARTLLQALFAAGANFARTVVAILKNVATGKYKNFFQALKAMGKGLLQVAVEALKLGGAILVAAFSAVLEVFGGHRSLTAKELAEAKKVFGNSIDWKRVKIANRSIPADIILKFNGGRPFTTMYIMNFKSGQKISTQVLIHELTHVWQAVMRGPVYAVEALHAQFTLGPAAYRVVDQDLIDNRGDFSKFNPEQQATIVDRYWSGKFGGRVDTNSVALLEPYAKQVFKARRARRGTHRLFPLTRRKIRPMVISPA